MKKSLLIVFVLFSLVVNSQVNSKGYNILPNKVVFNNKDSYQTIEFGRKYTTIREMDKGTKSEPFNFKIHECFTPDFMKLTVLRFAKENGFFVSDSVNSFIKDATRDLYVDIIIDSAWLLKSTGHSDMEMALYATYKLCDVNGKVINTISKKHDGPGRGFGPYGYSYGDAVNAVCYESVEQQLFALATTDVINRFVANPNVHFPKLDLLQISSPNASNSIANSVSATVTISPDEGHGSGVIITPDGYVLTSLHVVSLSDSIEITLNSGSKYPGKVIRTNAKYDVALVKISSTEALPYISVSSLPIIEFGEDVFAVGTPADISLGQTMNKGIISGLRKLDKVKVAQTDVSVSPGNSGGPLINKSGALLGIVDSKISGRAIEGIAFALSAEDAIKSLSLEIKP